MTIREELAKKFPERVERSKTSRAVAVILHCIECCGGSSQDAGKCEVKECFLWPHGPAGRKAQGEQDAEDCTFETQESDPGTSPANVEHEEGTPTKRKAVTSFFCKKCDAKIDGNPLSHRWAVHAGKTSEDADTDSSTNDSKDQNEHG